MDEKGVLVRIDQVSAAIKKAEPDQLGKAIRLLDAMRQMAVGKKWVRAIGSADAWCLKARRRAGEIVEATERGDKLTGKGPPVAKGARRGRQPSPRADVREEMGITRDEAVAWQAVSRIPEPIFDEFVAKVEAREEEGTVSAALEYGRKAKLADAGEPETHVRKKKSYDQVTLEDLTEATEHWLEAAAFDRLEEMQDPKALYLAVEIIERTMEYARKQLERLHPLVLKGASK